MRRAAAARALDLVTLFESLPPVPTGETASAIRFSASPLPGLGGHRLARDQHGSASLLLDVEPSPTSSTQAPIELEHLSVQHALPCRLHHPDGSAEERRFTAIRCTRADSELRTHFLRVISPVVSSLGPRPSMAALARAVATLVELFRALEQPARKSVQGLWAELHLIARASDPASLIAAWHADPDDRYDFHGGEERVEVKSANGRRRAHQFSLDQLRPPTGVRLLIASVLTERAGGGTALGDLVEEVRGLVAASHDLVLRVDQVIFATLGGALRDGLGERFDRELADASLTFYASEAIPSIRAELPPQVSDVRFRADLTEVAPLPLDAVRSQGGLFAAIV